MTMQERVEARKKTSKFIRHMLAIHNRANFRLVVNNGPTQYQSDLV